MARSCAISSCSRASLDISCLFQASSLIILSRSLFSMTSKKLCCMASCFCITCFIRPSKNAIILWLLDVCLFRLRLRPRLLVPAVLDGCPSKSITSSSSSSVSGEEEELLEEKLIPTGVVLVVAVGGTGVVTDPGTLTAEEGAGINVDLRSW